MRVGLPTCDRTRGNHSKIRGEKLEYLRPSGKATTISAHQSGDGRGSHHQVEAAVIGAACQCSPSRSRQPQIKSAFFDEDEFLRFRPSLQSLGQWRTGTGFPLRRGGGGGFTRRRPADRGRGAKPRNPRSQTTPTSVTRGQEGRPWAQR